MRVLPIFSLKWHFQVIIDFLQIIVFEEWYLDDLIRSFLEFFLVKFHFREVEGRARVSRENENDDQRDEEKRVELTAVWHGSLVSRLWCRNECQSVSPTSFGPVSSLVAIKKRTECLELWRKYAVYAMEKARAWKNGRDWGRGLEEERCLSGRMESEKSGEGSMVINEEKKEKARRSGKRRMDQDSEMSEDKESKWTQAKNEEEKCASYGMEMTKQGWKRAIGRGKKEVDRKTEIRK